ncbi:MAG: DUF1326 domain-containing protein [Vicinamibacterales bacterium]
MKQFTAVAAALVLAASVVSASGRGTLTGEYVEARTAEVFAGGCVMNSEAGTTGRQAVMAWRVTAGTYHGVTLDGLTVVAAVAGDANLGMREMGGEAPTVVKAVITVDARASADQRDALVKLALELSGGLITDVVRVDTARVRFATTQKYIEVSTPDDSLTLVVDKEMKHDPSCGAMQWFSPLSPSATAQMGTAETHAYAGTGLGCRWSAPNKRSAFWGTFTY